MIVMIVSTIVCVLFVGLFLISYLKSNGIYDEYMDYVDKEEYGLKDFIPMGLWLNEAEWIEKLIPMQIRMSLAQHHNQTYQKVLELRGPKEAEFYFYIHNGYRKALAILSGAMVSIVGAILAFQQDSNGMILSAVAVVAFFAMPFVADSNFDEQLKKRRLSIQMEFPEFVNKLTLLVNAGMTISKAWEKIINENKREHILYDEMRYALAEIKAGKPEAVAYEEFARRCKVKEVTKFVSIIVMNLRRGGAEVVPVLREQGNECWEMRKSAAKQLGEEASTKILMPMMIMFIGIIIIVVTPAALSMMQGM